MEDYLFQKFNTVVWKTAKKKERKEMSTKTMMQSEKKMGVRAVVQIGMLAAVAVILMLFEIPLPFAPTFYKIDLSEVPVLVGCFAMGPMAGVLVELVKILLNFVILLFVVWWLGVFFIMYKHFYENGTGIRSVLDIYVFRKYFKNQLNEKYIKERVKLLEIEQFEKNINQLSLVWFECEMYNQYVKSFEKRLAIFGFLRYNSCIIEYGLL